MNASVQLTTAPWSGYSTSPGASASGLWGGGPHTPVWRGSGFNWGSIVGFRAGGPISTLIQNPRGQQMTAAFVRRFPGGSLHGLGQIDPTMTDPSMIASPLSPSDIAALSASNSAYFGDSGQPSAIFTPPTSVSPSAASVLGPLVTAAGAIGQQYMSYQNPLLQKQTVALSPSGQVTFATNQPTTGVPGLTTAGLGAMLPILLIGAMVFMMAKK